MAKILLIEDHKDTAKAVCMQLEIEGHELRHLDNGSDGLEWLLSGGYDLAIVDWELPGLSGLEICQVYRSKNGATPILMLTGRGELNDKIDGLDSGADDYMPKPFSLKELAARVRAILRRPAAIVADTIVCGNLRLDPISHIVFRDGAELTLAPREFALLEFFMKNPNVVFSTEALLQRVWSRDEEIGPDALRTAIKRIRKQIDGQDDSSDSLIENIPRVGYRLRSPAS